MYPTTEEMKTTRPFFRRMKPLVARCTTRKAPVRLVSMTSWKSASFMRTSRLSLVMPAFATSTSTGPNLASTSLKAASTEAESVTSAATVWAPSGPSPPEREVMTTLSPAATKASAMARPMPRLPPVTSTVRAVEGFSDMVEPSVEGGRGRVTASRGDQDVTAS